MAETELKTIKEWFDLIKDDNIKNQVFRNTTKYKLLIKTDSIHNAINRGFNWASSNEGQKYWSDIYKKLEKKEKYYKEFLHEDLKLTKEVIMDNLDKLVEKFYDINS